MKEKINGARDPLASFLPKLVIQDGRKTERDGDFVLNLWWTLDKEKEQEVDE